jgi:hypothetical protein
MWGKSQLIHVLSAFGGKQGTAHCCRAAARLVCQRSILRGHEELNEIRRISDF